MLQIYLELTKWAFHHANLVRLSEEKGDFRDEAAAKSSGCLLATGSRAGRSAQDRWRSNWIFLEWGTDGARFYEGIKDETGLDVPENQDGTVWATCRETTESQAQIP